MSQTTRIIHVSDPHTSHHRLPAVAGDILIVSGDVSKIGSQAEFTDTLEWMRDYPCPQRIFLPGNHDYFVEQETERAKILCLHFGVKLLIDELALIAGLRIYGCPWIQYHPAYNWHRRQRLARFLLVRPGRGPARRRRPAGLPGPTTRIGLPALRTCPRKPRPAALSSHLVFQCRRHADPA